MALKLDAASRKLLITVGDELFIGVVKRASRVISLYRAGTLSSRKRRVFPSHEVLLAVGESTAHENHGFSFQIKNGRIRVFYRNSSLNLDRPGFCMAVEEMEDIIEALGLKLADDFADYP
jgi:hypothetical protein